MYKVAAFSAAALFGVALAQGLTVNTPAALVQCQPALLSWSSGTGPYYLAIIPGGQPSAAALENLPTQTGNSYTWTVDLASGQSVTLKITDSTGAINYSDKVTIQAGTSTTCGAGSGSASAAGSSAGSNAVTAVSGDSSSGSSRTALPSSPASLATSSSFVKTTSSSSSSSAGTGIPAANAGSSTSSAPATSSTPHNGAASLKAASGLLIGGLVLALAA